jgi:hypothetical protein
MKKLILSLFIFLCVAVAAIAQERTITGTVTGQDDGLPLPGVSVRLKATSNVGTQTNADGKFSLRVPAGSQTLVFSFVGYETREVSSASGTLNVILSSNATGLDGCRYSASSAR